MANVSQILDRKGRDVLTIRPEQMVLDALKSMAEADVGSVMVMSGDAVEGIFTERQYARKVFLMGKASPTTPVRDVMERDVIFVTPDQSVEACMALMTEKRIRHLPVLDGDDLVGMVSIGDVVRAIIADQEFVIAQLERYIAGER